MPMVLLHTAAATCPGGITCRCWRDGGPAQTGARRRWAGGQDWFPRLPHSTQATPPSAHAILESTQHTVIPAQPPQRIDKQLVLVLGENFKKILLCWPLLLLFCPLRDRHPNSVPPSWSVSHSPAQRNSKHLVKDLTQANDEPNYSAKFEAAIHFLLHLVFRAD